MNMQKEEKLKQLNTDILIIKDDIEEGLLLNIVKEIENRRKKDKLSLFLITNGGDGNVAFKIARYLQFKYKDGYEQYVIDRCKSAGTLICCGAKKIFFVYPFGELGPLDLQLINIKDFDISQKSVLDIFQCLDKIQQDMCIIYTQGFSVFKRNCFSTEKSLSICRDIVKTIYEPICNKLDPYQIGEYNRKINISLKYMQMMNNKSDNLKDSGKLINGYPSHSFVIDYEEAKNLFKNVEEYTSKEIIDFVIELCNNKQKEFYFYSYDNDK